MQITDNLAKNPINKRRPTFETGYPLVVLEERGYRRIASLAVHQTARRLVEVDVSDFVGLVVVTARREHPRSAQLQSAIDR